MNEPENIASNLLVIISDEHRKDAMGCVGHPRVKTPNLDRLAASGTLFTNAYTPSPMCVPTRAALACGDYVHKTGYWDSATPYDGTVRSWMAQLRDQDVETVSIGKLHFKSSSHDHGFSQELLPMHVVNGVGWAVALLREKLPAYPQACELADDVGVGSGSYTNYDLHITRTAEDWLKNRESSDTPWAAFVSLVSPHYPLTCPEEFYRLYDPAKMELPIGYGSNNNPDHTELQNLRGFFDYDKYFDEQKTREAIAAYYGLTSFMDNCIGRILKALELSGQANNTVVVYVSDHGDMLGDQGYWTKQVMYEQSAGVPMIATGPGIPVGRTISTGTTLLDLAATAVEVTGVGPDDQSSPLPGLSLRTVANEKDNPDRTILSEYHDGGSTTGTFMIRWWEWKYIYYVGHKPQLFNLQEDPHELRDLADERAQLSEEEQVRVERAMRDGESRLRGICDPEAVNRRCFSDQKKRIEELGGEEACLNAYVFNHTPAPAN